VKWKTPFMVAAVFSGRLGKPIWLTTATDDGREMFGICVDRNSGKIIFDQLQFSNVNLSRWEMT